MTVDSHTKTIPLSKTTKFIVDNRGRTAPTAECGIPLIATNCISNEQLYPAYDRIRFVTTETYENWFRSHPVPGDIILTNKGSQNGAVCLVPDPVDFVIAQDMVALRADEKIIDPLFLFAALRSAEVQREIKNLDVSGIIPHFKKSDFDKLHLPYPKRHIQEVVGRIYFDFCAKIELNRRMNAKLEEMARALFQTWFVDFDPVRAKLDGRQPFGLDPDTAALFPATFDETTGGNIPHGWRVGSIYEVANVIYGAPFASSLFNSEKLGKPLIRIRDLPNENPDVFTTEVHPKGYLLQPGDIAVGMDGEFRAYLWAGVESWLNQRVCVFAPKQGYSAAFVRSSVIAPLAEVEATETATTVIHLGKNDIDRFTVVIPPAPLVEAFELQCQPWYDQIVANKQQSRTLATLRDTLLPKLLSGEIRFPGPSITP